MNRGQFKKGEIPKGARLFTSENANDYLKERVEANTRNARKRKACIKAARTILTTKIHINDSMRAAMEQLGLDPGNEEDAILVALSRIFAKALKDGNLKDILQIVRLGGCHYDQSEEALGGTENPISVVNAIPAEMVRKINMQLEELC